MSSNKRLRKAVSGQEAEAGDDGPRSLSKLETTVLGLEKGRKIDSPYVSLKYYRPDHQCLSQWESEELKAFSQFCVKLTKMRWPQIYQSGGSPGNKTGLGYTKHDSTKVLPHHPELATLSEDLTWFELRVDGKMRVHGFRMTDAFFLVFLDKDHAIYPG